VNRAKQAAMVFSWRNAGWTQAQIQAELGVSYQSLWTNFKSREYEKLVEALEDTARMIHSNKELFRSLMKTIRIPFSGSDIETPRILAATACQPLLGPPKQLAGGADSPRKPISA